LKKLLILLIALIFTACNPSNSNFNPDINKTNDSNTTTGIKLPIKNSKLNDIEIFFSKSGGSYKGGIDEKIVSDINSSQNFIYLALYELTNKKIKDALINAYNRGVEVKVVTDDESFSKKYYLFGELKDAGVDVKTDEGFSHGLMHDKFMVIDNRVLWSGSGNYTIYSFYRNYENYFRVTNSEIIANYKSEFEELYSGNLTKGSYISSSYEVYFSPEDDFRDNRLIPLVKSAKNSVYIMAFALNDAKLKDALVEDKNRGVDIHIIFDKKQTEGYQKDYTQYYNLKNASIDTVLVGDSNHKMHNKVIIIDGKIVSTGSYNFTVSANYDNCENELIIKDKEVAKKYIEDFMRVYENKKDENN